MFKSFFSILLLLLFFNLSFSSDLPEYIIHLKEYYTDMLYFSKNMQDFSPLKIIVKLEGKEYFFSLGDEIVFKRLSDKEKKRIKACWKFSKSRFKEDSTIGNENVQDNPINIEEKYKEYYFKKSNISESNIEKIYYAKDDNYYKFCYNLKNSINCIYLSFEYYFIKTKNLNLQEDFSKQGFKFKIIGMEDLSGLSNLKKIKIYGEIVEDETGD